MNRYKVGLSYVIGIGIWLFVTKVQGQNSLKTTPDSTVIERVVVFNQDDYFRKNDLRDEKNIIKVNVVSFLIGDFPIYYEGNFTNSITGEIGIGITLRNFFNDLLDADFESFGEEGRHATLGYSFRGGVKFYPSTGDDAPYGYYIFPQIQYRKYNTLVDECNASGSSLNQLKESKINIDYKIEFGYQDYFESNLIIDYYFGFGVRKKNHQSIDCNYNNTTGMYDLEQTVSTGLTGVISMGIKLGFAF